MKPRLAIDGGTPVRRRPFPGRGLMDRAARNAALAVFDAAERSGLDFGYEGPFERRYTAAFARMQGGGYADAVSSGTAAAYVALAALGLKRGGEIVFSPVTDPGPVSAAILLGHRVRPADAAPGSFNVGVAQFEAALTPRTRAAVITHLGGAPAPIAEIAALARRRGIPLIEDCSQAHGALYRGRPVGSFGRIAFFSTMFSKNHSTGGCGGVVYTRERALHWRARGHADRGKPFGVAGADLRDPGSNLFPAMNFNQDELSCAIGAATLAKLPAAMRRRAALARRLDARLARSRVVRPMPWPEGSRPAPFFRTLLVDAARLKVGKAAFARAVAAEGAWINPDYGHVVAQWPWTRPYLAGGRTPNAEKTRAAAINVLFTERFTERDMDDVAECFLKAEAALAKPD